MINQEAVEYFQPLGSNDPAYTAVGVGNLDADTPAFTPLMLKENALAIWDGGKAGTAVGVLALDTLASDTKLTYYKSGTFRSEDIKWPEGVTDEAIKFNAFVGTTVSVI